MSDTVKQFQRFSKEPLGGNVLDGKATQISSVSSDLKWTDETHTTGNIGYRFVGWHGHAYDINEEEISSWDDTTKYPILHDAAIIPQAMAEGFCLSNVERIDLSAQWAKVPFSITYVSSHVHAITHVTATLSLDTRYPHQYEVGNNLSSFPNISRTEQAILSNGYDITWDPPSIQPYHKSDHPDGVYGNKEITSIWTPHKYTISYEYDGGEPVGSTASWPKEYHIESPRITFDYASCPIKRAGYNFSGWSPDYVGGDGRLIGQGDFTTSAQWTVNEYTLKYYGGDNLSGGYLSATCEGRSDGAAYYDNSPRTIGNIETGKTVTFTCNAGEPDGYKLNYVVLYELDEHRVPQTLSTWSPSQLDPGLTVSFVMPPLTRSQDSTAILSAVWRDVQGLITFYPNY